MIVVGGGASAVEALEYAFEEGAKKVYILSRRLGFPNLFFYRNRYLLTLSLLQ